MSTENLNQEEQKAPSKEEVIAFFQEQIEVKKVQLELQQLNTALAVGKAEELKALSFIAQMTSPKPTGTEYQGDIPHILTQADLDANPELAENGFKVGDEVVIPKDAVVTDPEEIKQLKKERSLKKK